MSKEADFTTGRITLPILKFTFPVLLALFLQAMYGAVDLLIVGQFASSSDVSAVATGSQLMFTITNLICSFSMGTTIFLGQMIGQGNKKKGGAVIGASICLFTLIGLILTVALPLLAPFLAKIMQAPQEAYELTISYVRICGFGSVVIIAYNLIGSIFRGLGDSKTPLITVAIACVFNIFGDLLFIAVFHLGTKGAALATVMAQILSVIISFILIRRKELPFEVSKKDIRFNGSIIGKIISLGLPIALQDFLVGLSFLIIQAIVNSLGLVASAGIGVAEKVCGFIMLVPSAFMQSMAAFVAQNIGAGKQDRAKKALRSSILVSTCFGVVMFFIAFFAGDILAGIFSKDHQVVLAAADYLKAYAIDCLLTCFLFCFVGFYNGVGLTKFVMIQGIVGAIGVRVPVSFFMSHWEPVRLFKIGLATPCSTFVQILLCAICFIWLTNKWRKQK